MTFSWLVPYSVACLAYFDFMTRNLLIFWTLAIAAVLLSGLITAPTGPPCGELQPYLKGVFS